MTSSKKMLKDYFDPQNIPDTDSGSERLPWLKSTWKKDGSLWFWIHCDSRGAIKRRLTTQFPTWMPRRSDDGEDAGEWLMLWKSYVTPDDERVHLGLGRYRDGNLRFRHGDGRPKYPPQLDPFLHCREWLIDQVNAGNVGNDDVVFAWDYEDKNGNPMRLRWTAGHLAKTIKETTDSWKISLDARPESIVLVVDATDVETGLQIGQFSGMLTAGRNYRERVADWDDGKLGMVVAGLMAEAEKALGDKTFGNPALHPYPFKLSYFPDKPGMEKYVLEGIPDRKGGKISTTDVPEAVADLIRGDAPDIDYLCHPARGDLDRAYAAMKRASQDAIAVQERDGRVPVELPIDDFFANWRAAVGETPDADGSQQSVSAVGAAGTQVQSEARDSDSWPMCGAAGDAGSCNALVDPGWNKCPVCGTKRKGRVKPPTLDSLRESGDARIRCASCMMVVDLGVTECPACSCDPTDLDV